MEKEVFKFVPIKQLRRSIDEDEEQKHSVYVSKRSSYFTFSYYLTELIGCKYKRLKVLIDARRHILRFYLCNDKDCLGLKINKFHSRKSDGKTRAYICSKNLSDYLRDFFSFVDNCDKMQLVCSDNISSDKSYFVMEVKEVKNGDNN